MNDLAHKGEEIEEWADLHFFRPLGILVARALLPTPVSANQVTVWCLVTGLVAGNLFFYSSPWLAALGFVMFIVSDILDSADGQLARLRNCQSKLGKILDGLSDSARWLNLYVTLAVRLMLDPRYQWEGLTLGLLALVLHSLQASTIEHIRTAYQALGWGDGEIDLPEDLSRAPRRTFVERFAAGAYRIYVDRQNRLFPATMALARALRGQEVPERVRQEYRDGHRTILPHCAWLGHNIRFVLLAVFCIPGWPPGFLWVTILPMSLITIGLIRSQERNASSLLVNLKARHAELVHA